MPTTLHYWAKTGFLPPSVQAAVGRGSERRYSFRDIVAPLMRNATLSLWTLMFIFIFTEVSATILLYSPNGTIPPKMPKSAPS